MASIRCDIGCPISRLTPDSTLIRWRMSAITSSLERSASTKGASISDALTPSACSSNSARPVLRATVCISGIESSISSALRPIASDSSSDTPGNVLTLMVKEPSLNAGKKLCPKLQNTTMAATKSEKVVPSTPFLWRNAHSSARLYPLRSQTTRRGSRSACRIARSVPSR